MFLLHEKYGALVALVSHLLNTRRHLDSLFYYHNPNLLLMKIYKNKKKQRYVIRVATKLQRQNSRINQGYLKDHFMFFKDVETRQSNYNWSFHWICLSLNSSAVYGPRYTKLVREVRGGYGIRLKTLVSMVTKHVAIWVRNVTFLTF